MFESPSANDDVSAAGDSSAELQRAVNPKFRFVCATRETREEFATKTALGRSLSLCNYSHMELRLFPVNSVGLATLYNVALREAATDPAILIFVHDDMYLCDFFWPSTFLAGLATFDILGIAGNKRRLPNQPAWAFLDTNLTWDAAENLSGIVGHGEGFPPCRVSIYGPPCQEVKLLDGLMLIVRSETLLASGIRFDERFEFHFYDMDFCRQAELQKLRMGTWPITAVHRSLGVFGTPPSRAAYAQYLDKWRS
jgi:Glycosyltransferase like family